MKKSRREKSFGRIRRAWTAMINLWTLRKMSERAAKLARTHQIVNKRNKKVHSRPWSHLISKEKSPWSRSKKSPITTNTANRRPNLVIKRNPPTKKWPCWSILAFPPRKLISNQASNLMNFSKPLTRKIRMPKKHRCQQTLPMSPFLANATNGLVPTGCPTSTNSKKFTSSTMPEKRQRNTATKHRNSTNSAARLWPKKRRQWSACSKKSAPMMTSHSTTSDQSNFSSS